MAKRFIPVPGERSREWLENARENTTEFVNPMPDVPLAPGRSRLARKRAESLGMETTLAKKWER